MTHKSQIWKLPAELDPVAASGLVLTQVGYNVGIRPEITPGDRVVVLGDGMVGHWAAQTFQHRGAKVLLLGKHDDRLSKFTLREGDGVVNITGRAALECVQAWTRNEPVAAVAHTAGDIETVESLYPCLKHFGHVVSAGFVGTQGQIDVQKLRAKELTLHAPAGWTKGRMDATLELLTQGVLTTTHLITHRFPASMAAEAFDLILSRSEPVLGVVLDWEGA
ncbi:MAG: zinc-binding dehydrogenase [Armatimonas sp.]